MQPNYHVYIWMKWKSSNNEKGKEREIVKDSGEYYLKDVCGGCGNGFLHIHIYVYTQTYIGVCVCASIICVFQIFISYFGYKPSQMWDVLLYM